MNTLDVQPAIDADNTNENTHAAHTNVHTYPGTEEQASMMNQPFMYAIAILLNCVTSSPVSSKYEVKKLMHISHRKNISITTSINRMCIVGGGWKAMSYGTMIVQ